MWVTSPRGHHGHTTPAATMATTARHRHRHHHLPSHLAAALFLALSLAPIAAGDPVGKVCGTSGDNYTTNSTYQRNIQSLSAALPKNASSSPTLFATAKLGAVPDIVYALALCRGDTNASACSDCVAAAFLDAQQLCAYSKDATMFYDPCFIRYSNQDFLSSPTSDGRGNVLILMNTQNVTAPFKVFDAAVSALVNATADFAASKSSKRFGTGVEGFQNFDSKNPRIYALAQCTPDMAPADCRNCISGLTQWAPKYFSGKQGGRVLGFWCNYRYELYSFFSSTPLLQLPEPALGPPAPAPAPPVNGTPPSTGGGGRGQKKDRAFSIIATVYSSAVLCTRLFFWLLGVWRKEKRRKRNSMEEPENMDEILRLCRIEDASLEFSLYDFSQIADATDNFSPKNKLGEGGFGPVYKGVFPDGQELAIKRLSARSRQGLIEFKNEIQVISKLQHINLVRLLGCCIHEEEKMLIYEYLANKSLDHFIFDPIRRASLKWNKRIKIVEGIAQGLLYLHNHSRLRIIHRDLKASNILLDSQLNPKISDFGMARIFPSDATQVTASRLVGTFGYMAPEYASDGLLSIKSDVFSFGVLLLEIISGKRSSGFQYNGEFYNLLEYAWQLWKGGRWNEFIDQSFDNEYEPEELMKYFAVALMCVQDKTIDRPTMPDVVAILSSDGIALPEPKQPAYFYAKLDVSVDDTVLSSRNDVSITTTNGR